MSKRFTSLKTLQLSGFVQNHQRAGAHFKIRMLRKQGRIGVKYSGTRQENILKAKGAQLKEKQELFTKIADRRRICNENVISELSKYRPWRL